MPTRAVFLDVFGTLLDMGEPAAAYLDILRQHGYPRSLEQIQGWLVEAREEVRRIPSGPGPDFTISAAREQARREAIIAAFLRRAGVERAFDACRAAIWESWVGTRVFRLYPETASVLAQLKAAGFILGTVSNWEPRLAQLCTSHGIAPYLDFILASEAEGHAKPGARLFELALERAGVAPDQALHVGDSPREDVQAAESLGIRAVLIERGGQQRSTHSPRVPSLEAVLPLARAPAWLRGRVERGRGEAAGFTQFAWVREQVASRLGFELYPGTLNLRLEGTDLAAWAELRARPGVPIEPSPGFCAARCYRVSVEGQVPGAIVLPMVSDYPTDVVEVLAPLALREALGLVDGTALTLAVAPQTE
ncbi:MAG: HAD-IA family hydrolase [Chloroflexi bacterium]|nr:HAD-IA family hydrolase [Chloroflexota bacterium]